MFPAVARKPASRSEVVLYNRVPWVRGDHCIHDRKGHLLLICVANLTKRKTRAELDRCVLPGVQRHRQHRALGWTADSVGPVHELHLPEHRYLAACDAGAVHHRVPRLRESVLLPIWAGTLSFLRGVDSSSRGT